MSTIAALIRAHERNAANLYVAPASTRESAPGLVRWITLRDNPRDGLASLIVGALSAAYVGPLVSPFLEPLLGNAVPDGGSTGLTAFLVGIGGISLSAFVVELFRKTPGKSK